VGRFATLGDMMRHNASVRPHAIALSFEGRLTTYDELERHANQVANGLHALAVRPGQHVVYLGKNSDLYFELFLGAAKAGAIMTPINWRLALPEVAYIIEDCKAPVLFVGPEFTAVAEKLAKDIACIRDVITMESDVPGWQAFTRWRDRQSDAQPLLGIQRDDTAIQLYTSGTTGRPKGAMIRHRNLLDMLDAIKDAPGVEWNRWTPEDVSLVATPVGHIGGSGWGITTFYHGAKAVVAREFDPSRILDYIEKERVSKFALVPSAIQFMIRDPRAKTTDFSCLKHLLYGSAPMPAELLREGMEVIGCGFVQVYGMTETGGAVVALPPEDHTLPATPKMMSAGRALPGVEAAIFDSTGRRLPPGEIGEIAIRSVANMSGYWNLPDATTATIDAEGWLRTGDAGVMDEDGYLYIRDRVKDMIITGGENVYPAEVENAIYGHPHVADVAVIGLPDEKWGEAVTAVIVAKPGAVPDAADIAGFARTRIAGFKTPKRVEFVAELPRNAAGKVLRRELRARFATAGADVPRNLSRPR
jgi:fatty-acyl-CoA synthase